MRKTILLLVSILLFSFGSYEILYPLTGRVAFSAYLD